MNLCIDEGNTAVKYGLFMDGNLVESGNNLSELNVSKVNRVIVSSVLKESKAELWCRHHNLKFHRLSVDLHLPFSVGYKTTETLGTDRLAAIAGAVFHFPNQNSLVIVAGTCITYNFIGSDNVFIGGAISPGIAMRFKALNYYTAALPLIEWNSQAIEDFVGNDSLTSIGSGVVNGVLQEIEGVINQYKSRFNQLNVVLSGGDSAFLVSQLKNAIFARPELLLEGLNFILDCNED